MTPLTWNADSQLVAPGQTRATIWGKWHNFMSPSGWERIDLSIREAGGVFSVSKAPYSIDVPVLANAWSVIQSTNTYDIWQKRSMPDGAVGIQKRYPTASPVAGIITAAGILFAGAFPSLNADRLVQLHEQEVRDLIVFNSEPPGRGPVEVPIEISPEELPALKSVGRGRPAEEVDFRGNVDIDKGLSFASGEFRGVKIKAPRVWNSAGKREPIKLRLRQDGSRLVGVKVIPRSFLAAATYPVYADTTSTFYPDPHVENTCIDGYVLRTLEGTWASHQAGDGIDADSESNLLTIIIATTATQWSTFRREILLFDTSAIPVDSTINSASLKAFADSKQDSFSDSLTVVASAPASNVSLAASDYQTVGSTAFSSAKTIASVTTSAYNTFALNATGVAAIAMGGITKLALRMESDRSNTEPAHSPTTSSFVDFRSADYAGFSSDPYLEIDYDSGVTVPSLDYTSRDRVLHYSSQARDMNYTSRMRSLEYTGHTRDFHGTTPGRRFEYGGR